ncbi:MAG: type II toxin-antitoxin system VapC family toxin [Chloroflexota bacterium]|nr:type II toxin-antitoxin system VapC family toxin [Chloroflexota bacterium]
MIALDTNVLVRYLVRDHAEHAEAARALFEGLTPEQPAFVCREVALEVVWVLERAYRFPRSQVASVLLELLATDSLIFEASDDVARAAWLYRQGGPGFSDRMVLAAAGRVEAAPLYTFDRRLSRVEGAELAGAGQEGSS